MAQSWAPPQPGDGHGGTGQGGVGRQDVGICVGVGVGLALGMWDWGLVPRPLLWEGHERNHTMGGGTRPEDGTKYIYGPVSVIAPPDQVWSMDLTPRPPGGGRGLTYLLLLLITYLFT